MLPQYLKPILNVTQQGAKRLSTSAKVSFFLTNNLNFY